MSSAYIEGRALARLNRSSFLVLGFLSLSALAFSCSGTGAKPDGGTAGAGGVGTGGTGTGGAATGGRSGSGTGGVGTGGTGTGGAATGGGSGPGTGGVGTGGVGAGGAGTGGKAGTGGAGQGGDRDAAVDGPADAAASICAGLAQMSLGGVLWREQPEGTNTWVERAPVSGGLSRLTLTLTNSAATTFGRYPTVTLTTSNSAATFNPPAMVLFGVGAGQAAPIDWYVTFANSLATGTTVKFHAQLSADQGDLQCPGAPAIDFSVMLQ